jgi:hypothetical protein
MSNEVAEKCFFRASMTSAAEAGIENVPYRSGKPLRHPKAKANPTFCAPSNMVRNTRPASSANLLFSFDVTNLCH